MHNVQLEDEVRCCLIYPGYLNEIRCIVNIANLGDFLQTHVQISGFLEKRVAPMGIALDMAALAKGLSDRWPFPQAQVSRVRGGSSLRT